MCVRIKVYDCDRTPDRPSGGGLRVSLMRVRIERDRDVESEYRYKFVVDSFYGDTEAFVYEFDNGPDTVEVVLQEGSEIDINVPIAFNMHYRVRATYQNQQMVEEKQEVMRPCNFCRQGELPARV